MKDQVDGLIANGIAAKRESSANTHEAMPVRSCGSIRTALGIFVH
jgi:hypothetical protein